MYFQFLKKVYLYYCCNFQIHKSFQAMEKANFGALLTNLVDEIPIYESESEEQDVEEKEGKSITPPPGFEEVDKNSGSRTTTLKSPSKLKSVLSFRKEKP